MWVINSVEANLMDERVGLLGRTVVVIGGSPGIGLEPARRARGEGASVILAGRYPERCGSRASSA